MSSDPSAAQAVIAPGPRRGPLPPRLTNPAYLGLVTFRDTTVQHAHPAIVVRRRVYAKAIRARDQNGDLLLPNAILVVDHFHLTKLANDALTKVRRR